ncbi:MAG: LTA synthase family protein [Proteobacteria bacterium]|nr:LTA synthase family protein [Pseudomonadota bacterium]
MKTREMFDRQNLILRYLLVLLFVFILLNLARLLFWQTYGIGTLPARAWLLGMRFDAAIAAYSAAPLIFPLLWNRLERISRVLSGFLVFITVCLVCADYLYFANGAKRLGYEAWVYLSPEIIPIALTGLRQAPLFFILSAAFISILIQLIIISARAPSAAVPSYRMLWFAALTCVSVLLVRGGFQRVPIRIGDSMISPSPIINSAVVNAPFSVISSALVSQTPRVFDSESARKIALSLLSKNGLQKDPSMPLLRHFPDRKIKKHNVVLILVESMTGVFTRDGGSTQDYTPNLNALAAEGLVFPKFVASGFRTTSGLFSALTGMPDSIGVPMMRRPELNRSFASLSRLLKEQGYRNYFVHGGLLDFDNLQQMLQIEEFDNIAGKAELEYTGGFKRTWGYADEYGYRHALKMITETGTSDPFFLYMLTVSSQGPYEIPEGRIPNSANPNLTDEQKYLNSIRYADASLGEFIASFKKLPQFQNTIFVVTGDHTHHGNSLDPWGNQHVPLVIYAPSIVPKGRSDAAGTHADIVPTLADILGLPWVSGFGRSLLSEPQGTAYFISGLDVGLWDGELLSFTSLDNKPSRVYSLESYKAKPADVSAEKKSQIRTNALSLYQFSNDLIRNDNVSPKR